MHCNAIRTIILLICIIELLLHFSQDIAKVSLQLLLAGLKKNDRKSVPSFSGK